MATRIREKAEQRRQERDKRPRAHVRYVRMSQRKAAIVIDLIRGKQVDEALAILLSTPKGASPIVEKLLNSAIANAENNLELNRTSLFVAECYANQGPTLKRIRAKARGAVAHIKKRTCHITVILDEAKKA